MLIKNQCMNCMEITYNNKKCDSCGYEPKSQTESNYCLPEGYELNDQYLVGVLKGSGGFANTYIGYDKYFKEKVAIKEFLPSEFVARTDSDLHITIKSKKYTEAFNTGKINFLNEARILKNLKDVEGTVNVKGFFKANNTAYMVMELIEGETLNDYLERQPKNRLEEKEAYRLMKPIVNILIQIHAKGLLHRDISPGNIIITKDGTAKLIDFGSSREMITTRNAKTVIIKEGYTPPEQYTSQGNQGTWTDVYSFAATAYRAVTGSTPPDPFNRMLGEKLKTFEELGLNIVNAEPTYKALELNIDDRYQSMQDLFEDLTKLDEKKEEPKPEHRRYKKKTIVLATIITALIATSIFVSAYLFKNTPDPNSENAKVLTTTPDKDPTETRNYKENFEIYTKLDEMENENPAVVNIAKKVTFGGKITDIGYYGEHPLHITIHNVINGYTIIIHNPIFYIYEDYTEYLFSADMLVELGDMLSVTIYIDLNNNDQLDEDETYSTDSMYYSEPDILWDFAKWNNKPDTTIYSHD